MNALIQSFNPIFFSKNFCLTATTWFVPTILQDAFYLQHPMQKGNNLDFLCQFTHLDLAKLRFNIHLTVTTKERKIALASVAQWTKH